MSLSLYSLPWVRLSLLTRIYSAFFLCSSLSLCLVLSPSRSSYGLTVHLFACSVHSRLGRRFSSMFPPLVSFALGINYFVMHDVSLPSSLSTCICDSQDHVMLITYGQAYFFLYAIFTCEWMLIACANIVGRSSISTFLSNLLHINIGPIPSTVI